MAVGLQGRIGADLLDADDSIHDTGHRRNSSRQYARGGGADGSRRSVVDDQRGEIEVAGETMGGMAEEMRGGGRSQRRGQGETGEREKREG